MRSYTLNRMPSVIELADGDADDASLDLEEILERELGVSLHVKVDENCLLLPPPYEVRRDGRTLRGEEYETYAKACMAASSKLTTSTIRFAIEEMYVFDWDAFDERAWAALRAAYESLPGWQGMEDLPRWFGSDERKGPYLWASVEPPGLQVAGALEQVQFDDWHRCFVERTIELPIRTIT